MAEGLTDEERHHRIDLFVEKTKEMIGKEADEYSRFNTEVNRDQAKRFTMAIGDINARWDPDEPGSEVHPLYLSSVLHNSLHGDESMDPPLDHFFGGIDYKWYRPLKVGDRYDANSKVVDVYEKKGNNGKRLIFVISEQTYLRDGEPVAKNKGTMIQTEHRDGGLHTTNRDAYQYSDDEIDAIRSTYDAELELLEGERDTPDISTLIEGDSLPSVVRGPLTLNDMKWWSGVVGPGVGGSIFAYRHMRNKPYRITVNEKTNWIQDVGNQHMDPYLLEQRGMPLPFANGVMMSGWTMPFVTNWMGDGVLKRHDTYLRGPVLYGDALWTNGSIADIDESDGSTVTIEWEATNQLGEVIVDGKSVIALPDR